MAIGTNKVAKAWARVSKTGALLLLGAACLLASIGAQAVIDVYEFKDESLRARYLVFVEEMRCPKCQNQNLAGSDSPIAGDLRKELYRLLDEGKSDEEIVDFMVARYGDFILYKPRVQWNTYLLWGAPLVLLGLGLIVVVALGWANRRKATTPAVISAEDQARLDALLTKKS
ncbi:cytochrome c-type biogenesis protein CcmH [Simiduia curdlanivorans]|uniref:cytochrome c-type biogenesis protein n=1 Tax=Simiduia curdlanivorans TaxID=1492769 RepID=UPI0025B36383|nr:cytochrome c-type biogenesis protein [Simiduia curdlanivorans]MDN3639402.1 cytochrome c-type biogenesis protein CcmH [Simiduia curdlanivorans]